MKSYITRLQAVQNMGLFDRIIRVVIGGALLAASAYSLSLGTAVTWQPYVMLVAIFPLLTGILGWCPVYAMTNVHSCGTSRRNACGTLPYEVDAALGHNPIADKDYDHSLTGSHHQAQASMRESSQGKAA